MSNTIFRDNSNYSDLLVGNVKRARAQISLVNQGEYEEALKVCQETIHQTVKYLYSIDGSNGGVGLRVQLKSAFKSEDSLHELLNQLEMWGADDGI